MSLTFIGSGEAFDDKTPNVSMVLSGKTNLLIDCGYNVPQNFWQKFPDKDFLDAVFISHFHADHVAGLPMLIMRMRQEGRKKPLAVFGPPGFKLQFDSFYELMYKGFYDKSGFDIEVQEVKESDKIKLPGVKLSFAKAKHLENTDMFVPTLAIRADLESGSSFCYSSDTVYSDDIVNIAKDTSLLIHDSYMPADSEYHKRMNAHSSPRDSGRAAKNAAAKKLLLFNIHRSLQNKLDTLVKEAHEEFDGDVVIPSNGQTFEL